MRLLVYTIIAVIIAFSSSCAKIQEGAAINTVSINSAEDLNEYKSEYKGEKLGLKEFLSWYRSADYRLNRFYKVAELEYSMNYVPAECMSFIELRREKYDYKRFCEAKVSYESMLYFNLKIEVKEGRNELLKYKLERPQDYEARIKYISFDMQNDIYAIQGKDTIYTGLYQFERIFDVAPYSNVMLAFDGKALNPNEELTIVYNDRLFNNGFIKFHYKKEQLTDLPIVTEL
jgi:hypothetical protein